jgi:hypothetical protein
MGAIPVAVGAVEDRRRVSAWLEAKSPTEPHAPSGNLSVCLSHPHSTVHLVLGLNGLHRQVCCRFSYQALRVSWAEAEATSAPGFVPSPWCAVKAYLLLTFSTPRRPLCEHWDITHWMGVKMPLQQARWNCLSWVLRHLSTAGCVPRLSKLARHS